jgi:membrane-associated phospholipid phosphatase
LPNKHLFKSWCVLLAVTVLGVTICIAWLDIPIALAFLSNANRFVGLGAGLSSAVLVAGESSLIAMLAIARITRGNLPDFAKALFVACGASLSSFVANDYFLKFVFGRENPSVLLQGIPPHLFSFFHGDRNSSFPSGHMVMATAFAVALIRLQPRTRPYLVVMLCIGAIALLVGDWHFAGDIIAGVFVGGTGGFVAGELWLEHTERRALT